MKFLVWFLLGLLVYWALRSQTLRNQKKRNRKFDQDHMRNNMRNTAEGSKPSKPIENMVACSYCQIYLPASEAIHLVDASSELYFCSEEHAGLYSNTDHDNER
jgi:hypothetical protein